MKARGDGWAYWRRGCVWVAGWLLRVAGAPPPNPLPETQGGGTLPGGETIDYRQNTYTKLADGMHSALKDQMGKSMRVRVGKQTINKTVTSTTGWLLWTIYKRIPKRGQAGAEMTVVDLMEASKLSRGTVLEHTPILEALGFIEVIRGKASPTRNDTNVYRVSGVWGKVTLILDESARIGPGESKDRTPEREGSDRFLHKDVEHDVEHEEQDVVVGPASPEKKKNFEGVDAGANEQDRDGAETPPPAPPRHTGRGGLSFGEGGDSVQVGEAVAALEALGVSGARRLVASYGAKRALAAAAAYPHKNPGYIATCIMRSADDWDIPSPAVKGDNPPEGLKYVTGKYAAFIQH